MALLPWKDPLGGIVISEHPASKTSELSSAISDPDDFYNRLENVDRLFDLYKPNTEFVELDDTIRVLWHAVHNFPKLGSLQLMTEILEIGRDDEKLRQLRNFLVDALLKPIGATSGKTAIPSHPSADFDEVGDTASEIGSSTRNHQAALKKKCLSRDGYQCVLSKKFDVPSRREGLYHPNPGEIGTFAQCSHILPFALRQFNEENEMETTTKATIWWALHRYFPSLRGKIDSSSINQEANAMTLDPTLHSYFGDFSIALQPTVNQNEKDTYHLHNFRYESEPLPSIITFTSHDSTIPLPDRDFLSVHYVVAKILNVSGLISKITDSEWPIETRTLKRDGSTDIANIISQRLLIDV